MKRLISIFCICFALSGCSSTLAQMAIENADKIAIAIRVGCAAAASAGCLDEDDVTQVYGALSTSETCVEAITDAVSTGAVTLDLDKLTAKRMTCRKFAKGLGL